ncbi:MAG: SET domain-containing protein-lysine N-methyltransferase [Betaproteobacteria bacterium]|jgi:SET domain-containing protein|nr:SET domain-containing protein-lysine N-methyltransferase [Betaproteobacteria bacterium]
MPTTQKKLLEHLQSEVYCKLGVSPVHGIGVFAVRPIPKGVYPLKSYLRIKEIDIPKKLIKDLPKGVRQQIDTFCYYDKKKVSIPTIGLNSFDLAVYLNHSKKPNLRFKKAGVLVSLQDIAEGEELFIDYDISFGEKHFF